MVNSNSPRQRIDESGRPIDRRTVLKGVGTGAVAAVGLVGTASAHQVVGKPAFYETSQLSVCVDGNSDVLMARENGDGGYEIGFIVGSDELDPYPQGTPRYSGNCCHKTDDPDVPDGHIIGLQVAGTRWVNPNDAAQEALAAEREQLDSTHDRPEGESLDSEATAPPCEEEPPKQTIFQIAKDSDDFNTLVAALEATGLDAVLDGEDEEYTVFAPTDAAFEALLEQLEISAGDLLENPDLENILTYHVTSGRQLAETVVTLTEIEMVNGETVSVDGTTLNDGQAEVVTTDIEASNGVIHVIDGVLLPE